MTQTSVLVLAGAVAKGAFEAGVTALNGRVDSAGASWEKWRDLGDEDFRTSDGRSRLVQTALASSSLPGIFAPTTLDGLGPCVDGGVVNNTPIGHARKLAPQARRVVVVVARGSGDGVDAAGLHGLSFGFRVGDALVHERLHRDLDAAQEVNAELAALNALVAERVLTSGQAATVKHRLGWAKREPLDVRVIRPDPELDGSVASGFFDKGLRREHVQRGQEAAERYLRDVD